jgi:hypothetical protein
MVGSIRKRNEVPALVMLLAGCDVVSTTAAVPRPVLH